MQMGPVTPCIYHPIMDKNYISVDCRTCVMKDTVTCSDCIVTYICNREPEEAVVISIEEWRSIRSFNKAGLLPELQHAQRENSMY